MKAFSIYPNPPALDTNSLIFKMKSYRLSQDNTYFVKIISLSQQILHKNVS